MKLFMSAIVNSNLGVNVNGLEIHQWYCCFYRSNWHNESFILSSPTFVKEFLLFNGVTKNPRSRHGVSYKIDKKEVKAHLEH